MDWLSYWKYLYLLFKNEFNLGPFGVNWIQICKGLAWNMNTLNHFRMCGLQIDLLHFGSPFITLLKCHLLPSLHLWRTVLDLLADYVLSWLSWFSTTLFTFVILWLFTSFCYLALLINGQSKFNRLFRHWDKLGVARAVAVEEHGPCESLV